MSSTLFQQLLAILKEAQQVHDLTQITTYDLLVDILFEEVEVNLSFFSHRFDQIFALYCQLLQTYQTEGTTLAVCSNLYEVFVVMIERRPTLIKKNQNRLLNLIQKVFEMFNMVDFQSDQNWMKPIQGYSDETDFSEESTLTKQIMSYIDRIANIYQYGKFIEFFLLILPNWWTASENNWKAKYSLLMFMSQLGENVQYPLLIQPLINCAIQSASNPHPKIRFGALQMIGQLADDMKPAFQQVYGEQLLPVIIGCTKDQVPRVHGHAMACLTNFLEQFQNQDNHILLPYVDQIINISQNFCHNGISIVKENTISSLASLSSNNILTNTQVQRILSIINFMLTQPQHQQPEYNQLIDQTVECLSMVLYGQKDKVQNVFTQSVNVMKSLKTRISASYLVNSWSRVCLKYENFTDLSDIFPQILHSVAGMVESYESEVDAGIKSIYNTIASFKGSIKPYAHDIIEFCKIGTAKLQEDAKLKAQLYEVLDKLVITLKNQAPDPQWEQMSKDIFQFLYQQVQNTLNQQSQQIPDYQSLHQALTALQKCVSHVNNLLSGQNTTTFSQSIFNFATKINELIKTLQSNIENLKKELQNIQDQIQKEDVQQGITVDEDSLEKLLVARLVIPDIFQSILKVSAKENQSNIIQSLYPYVSGFLQNDLPHQEIRYGLYFLCDFLTALNYDGIQQHATVYESKFTQFCVSPNIEVRNCAVFGLGEFMKLIPVEKTDENLIFKWLNLLWNSLQLSSEEHTDKKKFSFARDNIVSALGKLIYSKRLNYPTALNQQVHKKWFENLPLNHDKEQGDIQHEILLQLLDLTPQTFISTKEDVQKLLIIFARYFTKRMNKKKQLILKNKIQTKNYLFKMKDWPIFVQNSDFLWNGLPVNHREILTQLMCAP